MEHSYTIVDLGRAFLFGALVAIIALIAYYTRNDDGDPPGYV